jgi:hypothetical protein
MVVLCERKRCCVCVCVWKEAEWNWNVVEETQKSKNMGTALTCPLYQGSVSLQVGGAKFLNQTKTNELYLCQISQVIMKREIVLIVVKITLNIKKFTPLTKRNPREFERLRLKVPPTQMQLKVWNQWDSISTDTQLSQLRDGVLEQKKH